MEEPLDNPIWHAATTVQVRFAERDGGAARFAPEVTALAGLVAPEPDALAALVRLMRTGEELGLFVDPVPPLPGALAVADDIELLQMVHDGRPMPEPEGCVELGAGDISAMRALADLARPGPFGTRTAELGTFLGVRAGDELVAMAGQRMRFGAFIEVSAVCTHPDWTGRGLSARLLSALLARINGAGATAILHVRADNTRAVALYERLGFRSRRTFRYLLVRATVTAP